MFKIIERVVGIFASILLFALMMITFVDVIGRSFFYSPLSGAAELTQILLATIVLIMLPSVSWRQEHIAVDLIDMLHSQVLAVLQQVLTGLIGTVLFGVIGWRLWLLGERAGSFKDSTTSLKIPLEPVFYGMSMAACATAVVFAASLFRKAWTPKSAELKSAELMSEYEQQNAAEGVPDSRQSKDLEH